MTQPEWKYDDEYKTWTLQQGHASIAISPRPHYCDRGRYIAIVSGVGDVDRQDEFPRYFMDLERAKVEMFEWLTWRKRCMGMEGSWHRWNARSCLAREFGLVVQAMQDRGLATVEETEQLKELWRTLSVRADRVQA